jgi:hypothetical protein
MNSPLLSSGALIHHRELLQNILGDPSIPPKNQLLELWRFIVGEGNSFAVDNLSRAEIFTACRLASQKLPVAQALSLLQQSIESSSSSSYYFDIAKHSLARASLSNGGSPLFSQELFAGVASFHASRELPGLIGLSGKIQNVTESIRLKDEFRSITTCVVASCGDPPMDPNEWAIYVQKVLKALLSTE